MIVTEFSASSDPHWKSVYLLGSRGNRDLQASSIHNTKYACLHFGKGEVSERGAV